MNEDRASRYHRLRRHSAIWSAGLTAGVLVWVTSSGWSAALRDAAASRFSFVTVAIYVIVLGLLVEVVSFPLACYRHYILDRRYGLSTVSMTHWLRDHAKAVVLSLLLGLAAAEVVYAALRRWPDLWWLVSAAGFMMGLVLLATAAPVLMLPLFYRLTPLDRDPLRRRLVALSAKAGVPVLDIYRWGLGEKTRRANAALVGNGATRRILLSDTLLEEYTDDEVEVIIAHELAHHVHRDIPKALLLECVLLAIAFFLCAEVLRLPWPTHWLQSPADVAGLPVLLLTGGSAMLAGTPLMHALSRTNERRADRYALTLTGLHASFISALRRLSEQNLAETRPSRLTLWLFYSHPPVHERIEAARETGDAGSGTRDPG